MSNSKQTTETKPDKKVQNRTESHTQIEGQFGYSPTLDEISDELIFDNNSIGRQVELLSSPKLQTIQRQIIAAKIGNTQGNRHLGKILALSKNDDTQNSRELEKPRQVMSNNTQTHPIRLNISSTSIQRARNDHAPFNEVDSLIGSAPVSFTPGRITRRAEGSNLRIHWPHTANSGVTLGYGYDMGNRGRAEIIRHLTSAGVPPANAAHLAAAARLKGSPDAENFVNNNVTQPWATITDPQRTALFNQIYPNYQSRARRLATSTTPIRSKKGGVNAAARGKQYVVPTEIYDRLHSVIREVLTDLTYPGQYSYGRHEKINPILNDYRLSTLEKLRAIRDYLNAATTTGIGRPARIRMRTQLIDQAIGEIEERMVNSINERREQLMALNPTDSEHRTRLQSELESLEDAYSNQHPSVAGLQALYEEDLTAMREQLANMPEVNTEERVRLESRIRILEQLYGSTI